MAEKIDFKWIKDHYFSAEEKTLIVKKGDILLDYNQNNSRLYLVLEGKFLGYLKDARLEGYPIFEATKNKFIGVYSYFSRENLSYSKVVAVEDSKVAFYDKALINHDAEELERLMPFLMSVIVNELYSRQHFTKKMAKEKYEDDQKLMKAEKMATLGQMAAGLAHELNNSIGVINSNLDQIQEFVDTCLLRRDGDDLYAFYKLGLDAGQTVSSNDARNKREEYESRLKHLSSSQIKKLSKTGISIEALEKISAKESDKVDHILANWELGCTFHNMKIAANHSSHVVRSVKQLGVAEHQWTKNANVNETIKEALVIVQNLTKRVTTQIEFGELPLTEACPGELVQVWINLIKNGIESMIQGSTPNAILKIKSELVENSVEVSISDNGPGIPEKIMSKVFEPSFTTKVGGLSFGLGLGLSIVQRIITEHDGTIKVSSKSNETIFTINIPLTQ